MQTRTAIKSWQFILRSSSRNRLRAAGFGIYDRSRKVGVCAVCKNFRKRPRAPDSGISTTAVNLHHGRNCPRDDKTVRLQDH
jgi:hypothetical protein